MALGSNIAERSRKTDLIIRIQLKRSHNGLSYQEVLKSTKGYRYKKVAELENILKGENNQIKKEG